MLVNHNRVLCVQVLLAMHANVEDRGIKGDCTPLMEAASAGHVDIVRLLITHDADVNAQSSTGESASHTSDLPREKGLHLPNKMAQIFKCHLIIKINFLVIFSNISRKTKR